eukprot:scaffold81569_cov32-Prasinocladus_malaysianus.AAC.1
MGASLSQALATSGGHISSVVVCTCAKQLTHKLRLTHGTQRDHLSIGACKPLNPSKLSISILC